MNPTNPVHPNLLKGIQATEKATNMKISPARASTESQFDGAFSAMRQESAEALIVLPDPFLSSQARRIAERPPVISSVPAGSTRNRDCNQTDTVAHP
jgi:hypothetical protein